MKIDVEKLLNELEKESEIWPYYSKEQSLRAEILGDIYHLISRCLIKDNK